MHEFMNGNRCICKSWSLQFYRSSPSSQPLFFHIPTRTDSLLCKIVKLLRNSRWSSLHDAFCPFLWRAFNSTSINGSMMENALHHWSFAKICIFFLIKCKMHYEHKEARHERKGYSLSNREKVFFASTKLMHSYNVIRFNYWVSIRCRYLFDIIDLLNVRQQIRIHIELLLLLIVRRKVWTTTGKWLRSPDNTIPYVSDCIAGILRKEPKFALYYQAFC